MEKQSYLSVNGGETCSADITFKTATKTSNKKNFNYKVDNWNIDTISPTELRSVLYFHQLFAWECTNSVRRSELLNTYLLGEEFLYSFPTFQMFAIHPFHKIEPFRLGKWTKIDTTGGNQRYDQLESSYWRKNLTQIGTKNDTFKSYGKFIMLWSEWQKTFEKI